MVRLKANEVIKQRIEILKKAGVSDDELRKHFFKPILSSAITLVQVSQSGVIEPHGVQLKQQEPHEMETSDPNQQHNFSQHPSRKKL